MNLLARTPLRWKLILVIMLTVGLALLLAMAAFLTFETRSFRASAQRELFILAEVLGENAAAAIDFQDPNEAERLLSTLRIQKRIVAAAILGRDGRILASYNSLGNAPVDLPAGYSTDSFQIKSGYIWLTRPVHHSGETLGTVYLRADLAELNARRRSVLAGGFLMMLLIGGGTLLLAMRMGRLVAEPILHLADAALRMAENQNSGMRVARESQDEVGVLVDAFNGLLDQLGERQARLEEAQHLAHLGSWAFHPKTQAFEWSEETFRIFGVDAAAGAPDLETYWTFVHPEDRGSADEAFRKALKDLTPFGLDQRIVKKDGSFLWVHISGAAFRTSREDLVLRGTFMDISDRKQSEAALLQGQKLESLGVLTGGIAHDFNNLLGALQGHLDLAHAELPAGSPAESYLAKAEKIIQKTSDLTRQMLAYSGRGQFQLKPLDLGQLVQEMGHLLSVSISKKAELLYEVASDLPAIVADPVQIQQVIMNLVINASDALGEREGVIRIRINSQDLDEDDLRSAFTGQALQPGLYVELEVQDNGLGMDAHTLARIFDPFFTTKFQGRGLGLAAMLGIVKAHKGGIKVYSELGKGTTFRLLFPSSTTSVAPHRSAPSSKEFHGQGTILVVEDEADIRMAVSTILEHAGFSVLQACDGREGLERFKLHGGEIRLVLLDLTMPHMDGAECLKALRTLDPSVPVLLSSGFSEHESTDALLSLGLAGFLQKPYKASTLLAKLQKILG